MIAGLKPYPRMKESGVPWLGEVPEHWQLQRMKTLLRERVQKGFLDEPLLAATQSKGVVRKEQYENRTVLALKDLHLLKLVQVGDFVISLRSFQGGIEYAREQGIISPAYTILSTKNPETHGYLAWLFKSASFVENLSLFVTGIRQGQNIDYDKLARSGLPVPPLPEQTAIVRFLDYMDRRIRRYIRAKQKLIKLLEEQKQAIIHRAVTRGLDPNVRLKPSGVAWLGDVPEHWEVVPLKAHYRVAMGQTILASELEDDGNYPVLSATEGDRYFGRISNPQFVLVPGDFVVPARGVSIGAVKRITEPCVCTQTTIYGKPRPRSRWDPNYLYYFMRACRKWLFEYDRTAIPQLTVDQVRNNPTLVPPAVEQAAIANFLDERVIAIDRAIKLIYDEIALLREYRTQLIADVVTGKLDVRETAARLPEETDAPEPPEAADAFEDTEEAAEAEDATESEEMEA